ncbi:MAG: PHP domain-containing protein [Spirochaetia bacterium]
MIDLHTHSIASDGEHPPDVLIELAYEKNIRLLALTDHDTLDGLEPAKKAADRLGIAFLPGVEIETEFSPGTLHILGLGLYGDRGELDLGLKNLREKRLERNLAMIEKMNDFGIKVKLTDIQSISGSQICSRPHFAEYLVQKGVVKNSKQAFEKFLTPHRPFYEPKETMSVASAINLILSAKGIPVLAHPLSTYLSWGRLRELIQELSELGIQGIEAFHSNCKPRASERLVEIAGEIGLFVTSGSDFHGSFLADRKLGRTMKGRKIPDSDMPKELLEHMLTNDPSQTVRSFAEQVELF